MLLLVEVINVNSFYQKNEPKILVNAFFMYDVPSYYVNGTVTSLAVTVWLESGKANADK